MFKLKKCQGHSPCMAGCRQHTHHWWAWTRRKHPKQQPLSAGFDLPWSNNVKQSMTIPHLSKQCSARSVNFIAGGAVRPGEMWSYPLAIQAWHLHSLAVPCLDLNVTPRRESQRNGKNIIRTRIICVLCDFYVIYLSSIISLTLVKRLSTRRISQVCLPWTICSPWTPRFSTKAFGYVWCIHHYFTIRVPYHHAWADPGLTRTTCFATAWKQRLAQDVPSIPAQWTRSIPINYREKKRQLHATTKVLGLMEDL